MFSSFRDNKHCHAAYQRFFEDEDGQAILQDILTHCHFMEGARTSDPNENLIITGRRDVATHIMQRLHLNVADVPDMVRKSIELTTERN